MTLDKRSVVIDGHRTSVSMEPEFWAALGDIARAEGVSVNALVGRIDRARTGNLSSAIRVYVLAAVRRNGA
jgi:predicted DNA-binding ribbon-helix-helix protein